MTDNEAIQAIIDGSGNSFHCKVLAYLRARDWYSIVSPYYTDNLTSKPREIDLVSEKAIRFGHDFTGKYGTIHTKLLIECKYIPQDVVFWFDNKDMDAAYELVIRDTPLRPTTSLVNDHHYVAGNRRVAKLFASKSKPNLENEVMYKALNQSLNATVYHRRVGSIIPRDPNKKEGREVTLQYPVIVCNSFERFWAVDMTDQTNPAKIADNFQLEINYAYVRSDGQQLSEYFLVDVVAFDKVDSYLDNLEKNANTVRLVL